VQAEIVTIGTELLLGEIVDTNSAWIAQQFTTIGLNLFYTTTVGDNMERIVSVLKQAFERSNIVITTGGVGPTVDDMTREGVARATGRKTYLSQDLVEEITAYFGRRGYTMTENNMRQAYLPEGATVIHNPVGTAPAFYVEEGDHVIISLPGVPHEMRYLMDNEVIPFIRERFGLTGMIKSHAIRTCGIGESGVDTVIGDLMASSNPTVGTRAHPGQTDVVVTAKADSEQEADALLNAMMDEIRQRLGAFVFGLDEQSMADVVNELLAAKGQTLAIGETSTRGEGARQLGLASMADQAFAGGVLLANSDALRAALGDPDLSEAYLAPSQALAERVAQALLKQQGADYALAIVGPFDAAAHEGDLAYFALATPDGLVQRPPRAVRGGPSGRGWLVHLAMDMLRRHLSGWPIV